MQKIASIYKQKLSKEDHTILEYVPSKIGMFTVSICLKIEVDAEVKLSLVYFDSNKEQVITLLNAKQESGIYSVNPIFLAPMTNKPISIIASSNIDGVFVTASIVKH